MITPRHRSVVSLAAVLAITLLGGCAGAPPHVVTDIAAPAEDAPRTVRFVNAGREYVHVYLVSEQREWLLGRVEPGARSSLRIPTDATSDDNGSLQLAVVVGERVNLGARQATRKAITIAQPGSDLFGQRWTFSQTPAVGQLTSLPEVGRQ